MSVQAKTPRHQEITNRLFYIRDMLDVIFALLVQVKSGPTVALKGLAALGSAASAAKEQVAKTEALRKTIKDYDVQAAAFIAQTRQGFEAADSGQIPQATGKREGIGTVLIRGHYLLAGPTDPGERASGVGVCADRQTAEVATRASGGERDKVEPYRLLNVPRGPVPVTGDKRGGVCTIPEGRGKGATDLISKYNASHGLQSDDTPLTIAASGGIGLLAGGARIALGQALKIGAKELTVAAGISVLTEKVTEEYGAKAGAALSASPMIVLLGTLITRKVIIPKVLPIARTGVARTGTVLGKLIAAAQRARSLKGGCFVAGTLVVLAEGDEDVVETAVDGAAGLESWRVWSVIAALAAFAAGGVGRSVARRRRKHQEEEPADDQEFRDDAEGEREEEMIADELFSGNSLSGTGPEQFVEEVLAHKESRIVCSAPGSPEDDLRPRDYVFQEWSQREGRYAPSGRGRSEAEYLCSGGGHGPDDFARRGSKCRQGKSAENQ